MPNSCREGLFTTGIHGVAHASQQPGNEGFTRGTPFQCGRTDGLELCYKWCAFACSDTLNRMGLRSDGGALGSYRVEIPRRES
jgi:hypothetical protein